MKSGPCLVDDLCSAKSQSLQSFSGLISAKHRYLSQSGALLPWY